MIMNRKIILAAAAFLLGTMGLNAQRTESLDGGWTFALGNASSMEADFTHGTEYFTYLSKARSADHSHSPIMPSFDDSAWQRVTLPHDWAVDLPYSAQASHSHGYKCLGWKYPENSVGWYRRHLFIPEEDRGKQISIEFEGIFRDSEVFCNGFYLGHERSGYASRVYTLTPYLNYGADNVITVRCDASTEEGWYYEGAGIYRSVYLYKAGPVALRPYSVKISPKTSGLRPWTLEDGTREVYVDKSCVEAEYVFADAGVSPVAISKNVRIFDAEGREVTRADHPWSPSDPYLYTLRLSINYEGALSDEYTCRFGVRTLEFSPSKGLLINGEAVKLKGANMHLDHAGVGVAVPEELWRYRIQRLKDYGFNAIRTSHNCASPVMLSLCDEMGVLVIDENRQLGVNREQTEQLSNMICRDRNHPCIILWSIGNEEWSLEHSAQGTEIALRMSEEVHRLDPTRPTTYGNSGGPALVKGVDVLGYNYIVQNPIEPYHNLFPDKCAVGTEETTGCGTRGHYRTEIEKGIMTPLNRTDTAGRVNVIEHGWKFYKERPWGLGLFYWTGFDYRGEPNPMRWPATGSQFGIFDYCGFPKDEAFYLRAAWNTAEPLVHVCGPYDGEVWVYSNCDEVRLYGGGRSLGKKKMPLDGHLVWKVSSAMAASAPFKAVGYRAGRKVCEDVFPESLQELQITASHGGEKYLLNGGGFERISTRESSPAASLAGARTDSGALSLVPDGQDIVILDICTSLDTLEVRTEGAELLGWGNGDPAFKAAERPRGKTPEERNSLTITPFAGRAQLLVRSLEGSFAPVRLHIAGRVIHLCQ